MGYTLKQGIEKGIEKGIEQGLEQGRLNSLVQMLSRGGTEEDLRRFHDATDQEIEAARKKLSDMR